MSYQFCCPQGHVLQGDFSAVGQLYQCPMCGSSFLVPPPDAGMPQGGAYMQGPPGWPAGNPPMPQYPGQGAMPGMQGPLMPQNVPQMPMQGGQFGPMAMPQQAYAPMPSPMPMAPVSPPPGDTPQLAPPAAPSLLDGPQFDLGFDPHAKSALPFELPGQAPSEATEHAAPAPPTAFSAGPLPPPVFPAEPPQSAFEPSFSNPAAEPHSSASEFLASEPELPDIPVDKSAPPKMLHIRCPSGHVVKASSELLGKAGRCPACKKTFELRYENSIEFQRRTQKLLYKEESQASKAWIAWTFLAVFFVFAALVGALLIFSH